MAWEKIREAELTDRKEFSRSQCQTLRGTAITSRQSKPPKQIVLSTLFERACDKVLTKLSRRTKKNPEGTERDTIKEFA